MRTEKCRGCGRQMTWADQRVQFGRLRKKGFDIVDVRSVLPRCGKCVTLWLRAQPPIIRAPLPSAG